MEDCRAVETVNMGTLGSLCRTCVAAFTQPDKGWLTQCIHKTGFWIRNMTFKVLLLFFQSASCYGWWGSSSAFFLPKLKPFWLLNMPVLYFCFSLFWCYSFEKLSEDDDVMYFCTNQNLVMSESEFHRRWLAVKLMPTNHEIKPHQITKEFQLYASLQCSCQTDTTKFTVCVSTVICKSHLSLSLRLK